MASLGIRQVMRGGVSGRAVWFSQPGASMQSLVVRAAAPSFPHSRQQARAVAHLAAARPGLAAWGSNPMAMSPGCVEHSLGQKVAELRGGGRMARLLTTKSSAQVAPIPRLPQRNMSTAPQPEEGGTTIKKRMQNMISEYGKVPAPSSWCA